MGAISVRVPDDLKERMGKHPDVNWSEIARTAFEDELVRKEREKAIQEIKSLLEKDEEGWDGVEEIRKWRSRDQ